MARLLLPSVFVIVLKVIHIVGLHVPLGGSANFSTDKTCSAGESLALIRLLKDDSYRDVAKLLNGDWMPEEKYRHRIENHSATHVVLTDVNFGDDGLYEFTCAGSRVDGIRLQVFVCPQVPVPAGGTVELSAHFRDIAKPIRSVRWERDGELVLELDWSTGKIRYGARFQGRASLSPDWKSNGDLTLSLKRVRLEDAGIYICKVLFEDHDERGDPAALNLTVTEPSPSPNPTAPPPESDQGLPLWAFICITGAATSVIVGPSAFYLGWLKCCRSRFSRGPRGGEAPTDVETGLSTEIKPLSPETNGGHCVSA
ncbi:uncharacterized protein AKAME5_001616800 [Lates japonicus]|uniref:Ig-like domain-containing protein n=1 Tax=Lates japonicus TaxID=270547 RepID=A0AAD3MZE3_LATJO|nr:uncharacterized protein AKAME5_001616800 [Lates japonicus]